MTTLTATTPATAGPEAARIRAEWTEAVHRFGAYLAGTETTSEQTAATYCRRVLTIGHEMPCGPYSLTGSQLAANLDSRNWSNATRKATVIALRRFYGWAVYSGSVTRSPLAGIPDGIVRRPGLQATAPTPAWRTPIDDYAATLRAAARRPATISLRRRHLAMLSRTFADPWTVTSDDLARFLSREDWSPETRKSLGSTARGFYRWAYLTDRITRDPALTLATIHVPRALPRPTPDAAVLDALEASDERTRLAIELGMLAGLRVGEVVMLQDSDVMATHLRVTGKGGRQRYVPLVPALATSLSAERHRRAVEGITSPWLFPSQAGGHLTPGHMCRLVSRLLPAGWTFHTLRHRFATQAYASTHDLRAVQELLGHSKPETTARYAAVPDASLISAVSGVGLDPLLSRRSAP